MKNADPRFQIYTQIYIQFYTRSRAPNLLQFIKAYPIQLYLIKLILSQSWSWSPAHQKYPMCGIGIGTWVRCVFLVEGSVPTLSCISLTPKRKLPILVTNFKFQLTALKILEKDPKISTVYLAKCKQIVSKFNILFWILQARFGRSNNKLASTH